MRRGFSLIELLVVIAILALLVGVAAPYYQDYIKEAKFSKAKADLDVLRQAVILFNSREDLPYQGPIASTPPHLPLLGENDFSGLQGQYLTVIPLDPWSKNYKLDPFGAFVYTDGANSRDDRDDIREYYVKELAIRKVEWVDLDNNRALSDTDLLYVHFNKPLWANGVSGTDFEVYENNALASQAGVPLTLPIFFDIGTDMPGYSQNTASASTLILRLQGVAANPIQIGVHSIAFKDELPILQKYQEVVFDRDLSSSVVLRTKIETNPVNGLPIRYAIRTNPVKIIPRN